MREAPFEGIADFPFDVEGVKSPPRPSLRARGTWLRSISRLRGLGLPLSFLNIWAFVSLLSQPSLAQPINLAGSLPKAGAKASCPDPALRLRFDSAPKLSNQGRLRIMQVSGNREVFSLDFKQLSDMGETGSLTAAVPSADRVNSWPWKDTLITREFRVHPIALIGNEAVIDLRRARLQPNTEYEVLLEEGLFVNGAARSTAIATGSWRFTTGAAPSPTASEWAIEASGASDFCTVQGAIDALPARAGRAVTLRVKAGTYPELVRLKSNSPVTLVGQGQANTRIVYRNSDAFNAGTRLRAAFGIESNQVRLFDLAIENSTPKGGTQAEALASWGDKLIVGRVHLKSFQDTFLGNGRTLIFNSLIEGDVDYLWGSGPVFLQSSKLRTLNAGYVVQARNEQGQRGFVFNQCELTTASGLTGAFLARSAGESYLYSEVIYNQCTLDAGYAAAGWKFDAGDVSKVLFAEYQSRNPQGTLVNVSQRTSPARQLTASEAQNYARVAFVLGGNDAWQPDTGYVPVGVRWGRGVGQDARVLSRPGVGSRLLRGHFNALGQEMMLPSYHGRHLNFWGE